MSLVDLLNELPYVRHLGIEVTEAADGVAAGRLPLDRVHASVPGGGVAHGGVAYALADTVGGAATMSLHWKPTPTVDMRMDYLAPATADLRAEAEVVRDGGHVATVDVDVYRIDGEAAAAGADADGSPNPDTDPDPDRETHVASARGTFKTGGGGDGSVWGSGVDGAAGFDGAAPGDDPE